MLHTICIRFNLERKSLYSHCITWNVINARENNYLKGCNTIKQKNKTKE